MTNRLILLIVLFYSIKSNAQTEIAKSDVVFFETSLDHFYSSFSIDTIQIYFIANDYYIHAIDKKTGKTNWSYYLANKSNSSPKIYKNSILVGKHFSEYKNSYVQLNKKTGDTIQNLLISKIETEPIFKEDIMYCTAINDEVGGVIMAYDLNKNSILWKKYIGHGVSFQPYFLKDKIVAYYENQYYFELDYNGNALDRSETCYFKNTEPPFEEHFCNIHYDISNQFHKDIAVKNVTIEEIKYHYAINATVILEGNKLKIINEKNKVKKEIVIDKIITLLETGANNYTEILKVEGNTVWFFYENILAHYDFKENKTIKASDLSSWNPHKVILEGNNVWLISGNDGQLVGLELN
ncbi:MAG: hypothetical protein C0412_16995 [Flavobacterium sp.]|nr:hypothetical protein [Flavobacterium sp.]